MSSDELLHFHSHAGANPKLKFAKEKANTYKAQQEPHVD
jgi:hypothetical protein